MSVIGNSAINQLVLSGTEFVELGSLMGGLSDEHVKTRVIAKLVSTDKHDMRIAGALRTFFTTVHGTRAIVTIAVDTSDGNRACANVLCTADSALLVLARQRDSVVQSIPPGAVPRLVRGLLPRGTEDTEGPTSDPDDAPVLSRLAMETASFVSGSQADFRESCLQVDSVGRVFVRAHGEDGTSSPRFVSSVEIDLLVGHLLSPLVRLRSGLVG